MSIGLIPYSPPSVSSKEKSMLGCRGQKGLSEHWKTEITVFTDSKIWTKTEDNDSICDIKRNFAPYGYASLYSGSVDSNDASLTTSGHICWDIITESLDVTAILWESAFLIDNIGGEFGIGMGDDMIQAVDFLNPGVFLFCIHGDDGVINANSSDGTNIEQTDISAFISSDTLVTIKVRLTATGLDFYVDGLIKGSHSTKVPQSNSNFSLATRNSNGVRTIMKNQFVEVWTE